MGKRRKIDMVILGLLEHENLSGYDIKKQIDNGISFFWKGSFGSIYPSLNAMEKEGLIIRVNDKRSVNKREKFLYSITEPGKKHLVAWLKDSKATNDLKYETLLKLFFGGAVGRAITIKTIEQFEQDMSSELQVLKTYQKNLSGVLNQSEDHLYFYLTVTFGVETYEGYLRWCKQAKQMLGKETV
ncbi:MAG: PadR family transcriptional regulator [Bilifractor sp.]|jgi:DNA-binding PadR family transcriptional regulator